MSWSKEEKLRIKAEMMAEMRTASRYSLQDFRNKCLPATPGEERDFNLLHWEAQEAMRVDEGIDFGPMRKWPGVYERKDWQQTEQRAKKQRAKGTRAHKRAEQKMRLAATAAPDTSKERLSEAADRIALRAAMRPRG
jgi:adenine deaminase